MSDLNSAMDTAFDEVKASSTPEASQSAPEPERGSPEAGGEAHNLDTEGATPSPATTPEAEPAAEPLSPQEIAELKKRDPRLYETYRRVMKSHTTLQQEHSALKKEREAWGQKEAFWQALENEGTRRQAVEALARSVGLDIQPTDQPQRQQAAAVADDISEEWSKVVGPEAAQMLRPLIEKTALAAVNGTLQPLQAATEYLQMDARGRQAEAQVSQFRSIAQKQGWQITPEVEQQMAILGQQILPASPIETVEDGVRHLQRLYRLATADSAEAEAEKRVYERMQKAAQTAEPARSVPSVGRERRTNITKEMGLEEAMDVAFKELA